MVLVNIYFEKKFIIQHLIILRKTIYRNNLLRNFYNSVRHHCPTQTHNELRNDIRTLIRFFSLVHGEKKFCNDSPITGIVFVFIDNRMTYFCI